MKLNISIRTSNASAIMPTSPRLPLHRVPSFQRARDRSIERRVAIYVHQPSIMLHYGMSVSLTLFPPPGTSA